MRRKYTNQKNKNKKPKSTNKQQTQTPSSSAPPNVQIQPIDRLTDDEIQFLEILVGKELKEDILNVKSLRRSTVRLWLTIRKSQATDVVQRLEICRTRLDFPFCAEYYSEHILDAHPSVVQSALDGLDSPVTRMHFQSQLKTNQTRI